MNINKNTISLASLICIASIGLYMLLTAPAGADTHPHTIYLKQGLQSVDLQRYIGKWYEIERLPNFFERKCQGNVTATYSLLPNNKIQVKNQCRLKNNTLYTAIAQASIRDRLTNRQLGVCFAPGILCGIATGEYTISYLDAEYQHAIITSDRGKYLWILSRTPTISPEQREYLHTMIRDDLHISPARLIGGQ